jgi:hypothetical protein
MGEANRVAAHRKSRGIVAPQNKMARIDETASVLEGPLDRGVEVVLMAPGRNPSWMAGEVGMTRLARRLETWRRRAGLTKVQAARVFEVPVQTWYRWIAGGEPSEANRAQLVKVLGAATHKS